MSSSENGDLSVGYYDSSDVFLNPLDEHNWFDLPKQLWPCP